MERAWNCEGLLSRRVPPNPAAARLHAVLKVYQLARPRTVEGRVNLLRPVTSPFVGGFKTYDVGPFGERQAQAGKQSAYRIADLGPVAVVIVHSSVRSFINDNDRVEQTSVGNKLRKIGKANACHN